VDELGGIDAAVTTRGHAPIDLGVFGTFAHAVRAWHAANEPGAEGDAGQRLEASLRNFEEAAARADTTGRRHLLEAARLIRAGDLTGASAAFEAAKNPPTASTPETTWGRVSRRSALARRWAATPTNPKVLAAYLGLLAVAELAVTFVTPLLVFPLHGGIVVLTAVHVAVLEQRPERGRNIQPLSPFLLAFLLAALIRVISLTLPLATVELPYAFVLAGVPMTVGALLVARASGFSLSDVGVVRRIDWLQVAVVVASVALGFVEFLILRPPALGPFPWTASGLVPALAVGISTGFPEELIFRGVMQTATRPLLGRWNWVYVSAVFAILHIGYRSVEDLLFVFAVGLLYGWIFERTRSIVGVSIGHGLANVVLFFVAPNMPELARTLGF
jgi:hypothetical protein